MDRHRVAGRGESLASARLESWLAVPPWTSCLASVCLSFPGRDGEGTSLPWVTEQEAVGTQVPPGCRLLGKLLGGLWRTELMGF